MRRNDIIVLEINARYEQVMNPESGKKGCGSMSKFEEMLAASKLNELVHKKDEDDKVQKTVLWVLAIVGAVAAVAAIAYAVYCFFTPDYLEDFEEDFDDDLGDEFFSDEDEVQ